MRTATDALGRGVGQAMLDHLLVAARRQGMKLISLETGSTEQFAAANRLYEKNGFERTGPFGDYADTPWTHFYSREI
jgi:putative acetyltransferase